ncbi:hypothetical protein FOL47_006129 [Perkinsus chesapeaki]|uniref:Uncharacterized protein n=1 Tax=Perkinsus chesapeaki TaxID=330153 RepID=A0A7J6N052_PERCH|nr:hypothetical protein FOL47_006129 [Perkinsus chesapeaki]
MSEHHPHRKDSIRSPTSARLRELHRRVDALQAEIDASPSKQPSRRGSTVEDLGSGSQASRSEAHGDRPRPHGSSHIFDGNYGENGDRPPEATSGRVRSRELPTIEPEVHRVSSLEPSRSTDMALRRVYEETHGRLGNDDRQGTSPHGEVNLPGRDNWRIPSVSQIRRLRHETESYSRLIQEKKLREDELEQQLDHTERELSRVHCVGQNTSAYVVYYSIDLASDHEVGSDYNASVVLEVHARSGPLERRVEELKDIIKQQDKEMRRMSGLLADTMRTSRGSSSSSSGSIHEIERLKGELSDYKRRAREAEEQAGQWQLLEKSVARVLARLTASVGGGLVAIESSKRKSYNNPVEFVYICVSLSEVHAFTEPDDPEPFLSFSKESMKVEIASPEECHSDACHSRLKLYRCPHACGEPELTLRCRNVRETEKWLRLLKAVGWGEHRACGGITVILGAILKAIYSCINSGLSDTTNAVQNISATKVVEPPPHSKHDGWPESTVGLIHISTSHHRASFVVAVGADIQQTFNADSISVEERDGKMPSPAARMHIDRLRRNCSPCPTHCTQGGEDAEFVWICPTCL